MQLKQQLKKEKEEQAKPKASRRKFRVEINEMENSKIEKINKVKSWFFENTKIYKALARLNQEEKKTQILKSEIKSGHHY